MTENIILVTLDSLRADHCRSDSRGEALAPTLRGMAEAGVEYEHAVAPGPRTPSSMPAIFTGEFLPPVNQEPGDFWERRRSVIRQHMRRHESLAERLQSRGYHTVGVTVNPWTQDTDFDRGFEEFVHINSETLDGYGPLPFRVADAVLDDTVVGEQLYWFNKREWFIRWTDFYETILDRIRGVSEPYFLWVFLLDTHQPYIVPGGDREESSALGMYYSSFRELAADGEIPDWVDTRLRQAYRDSIRSVDRCLDRLLQDTADDDPIVVVHADHGEAFGEHDTYGHEQQLYEENIRVPLVVHNAGTQASISEPLSLRRLPQLVEDLSTPTQFDPEKFTTGFALSAVDDGHTDAITTSDWKLIRGRSGPELYDLHRDPGEETDCKAEYPSLRDQLGTLLGRHRNHRTEQLSIARSVTEGVEER